MADETTEANAEETPEVAEETPEVTEEETPEVEETTSEATAEETPVEEPEAPLAVPAKPERRAKKRLPRALRHKHAKRVREKPAARKSITRTPKPETAPAARQERRGVVVSDKGEKTIVVSVDVTKLHPKYKKVVRRTRKFHAHDEENAAGIGDVVRIVESRRISKTKNWRLAEVVEKAK